MTLFEGAALLDPWFLPGAIVALLVTMLLRRLRRRAALPSASVSMLAGLPVSLRQRLRFLPGLLIGLAVLAFGVALARPVAREVLPIRSQGIDILLALDVSSSMGIDDAGARRGLRRVEAARDQAMAFAEARKADRVGLLCFARFPELRCPLTLDEQSLMAFLRSVDTVTPRSAEDATAIGAAVARSAQILGEQEGSKIVVLLTDGEETANSVSHQEAAKLAADSEVKVYAIGFGRGTQTPFGQSIEPDFSSLEKIAELTGGRFFRARSERELADVYAEIDRLETRELEDPRFRTHERFELPLLVGLGLLMAALGLRIGWIREVPS